MPTYRINATKALEGCAEIEAVSADDALAYFESLHIEAQNALVEQAGGWNMFAIETDSVELDEG